MESGVRKWSGIIYGRPATKKNSGTIIMVWNGRRKVPKMIPSDTFLEYEKSAAKQLNRIKPNTPIEWPMRMTAHYYLPDHKWWPDLIGLEQATQDILETAGIITNDRLIVSKDGSRIAGIDAKNPMAEITLCVLPPTDISYRIDKQVKERWESQCKD